MKRRWSFENSKIVWGGEWVKVRNGMNKRFPAFDSCSNCMTMKCGPVWYSIKSKEVRCMKCFTPKGY